MSESISRVCLIGGGPAGLAAAIALTQAGCLVTVVDRAVPPIDKACGEGLMPDSVAALRRVGVTIPIDAGFPFRGIRFSDSTSSVAADFPNGTGIGIRRTALHDLLLKRALELGVVCLWGAKSVQLQNSRVLVDGKSIETDLTVAADGQNSSVRRLCGLDTVAYERRRYGFRRHYRTAPWSPYMELHWGPECQLYVTPVRSDEVCVASMSRNPRIRLDHALRHFPDLEKRLASLERTSPEMGALTVTRRLRRVSRGNFALIGDASGSVDAITGEGLCLAFRQALSLAGAVGAGEFDRYQHEHRMLSRTPHFMASLMLLLDRGTGLQRRALASLALHPGLFESLLAVHVGARSLSDLFSWQLFDFCRSFLEA